MKHSRRIALSRATFSGFLLSLLSLTPSHAAPTGAQVTHGSANLQQSGNLTTIRASNGAIINYTGFNIGRDETVTFVQPSSSSRVLNRVNSPDPTNIFGQLNANGIVYLVNPNGIYFQNGSMLNVGHLYAAAGHLSDTDFLTGKNHFSSLTGDVQNSGSIMASGDVHLFGEQVANFGSIASQKGVVVMTAGSDVLVGPRDSHIYVRANAKGAARGAAPGVQNAGQIRAGRTIMGAGDMYAVAISNTGVVRSRQIALDGGRKGAVKVSGTLDASSTAPRATGGKITVTGQNVALQGATLDASGAAGGGTVLVGGDFHGKGTLAPAQTTSVDASSSLKADATLAGAGGKVVVWSEQMTSDAGSLSAQGAGAKGAGGSAEISSKATLDFTGTVNLQGSHGQKGSLLLDPRSILITNLDPSNAGTIAATTPNTPLNPGPAIPPPNTQTVGYAASPSASVISPAVLGQALVNSTVTLQAIDDITIHSSVIGGTGGNLVLQAGRSILFGDNQPVTITLSGSLTATAQDPGAVSFGVTAGTPALSMFSGSAINTGGAALALTNNGGGLTLATLNAGSGAGAVVTLSAAGAVTQTGGITASSLLLRGGGGAYTLTNANNSVGKIASDANGTVTFSDAASLQVDTVSGVNGMRNSTGAPIGLATKGTLTINQAIFNGATGFVRLESNGSMTQSAAGVITTGTLGVRNDSTGVGKIDLTGASNSFGAVAGTNLFSGGSLLLSTTSAATVTSLAAAPGFIATGGLNLTGSGNIALVSGGAISLLQAVSAPGGAAYLVSNGSITESPEGTIIAGTVGLRNNSPIAGTITLGGNNAFGSIAAANQNSLPGSGAILLSSTRSLTVSHLTSISGAGGVLFADTAGVLTTGTNGIDLTSGSTMSLAAPVNAGSATVHLTAQTGVTETSAITAGAVGVRNLGTSGSIQLVGQNQIGSVMAGGVVAAVNNSGGLISVTNTNGLTVGTVPVTTSFPQLIGVTTTGSVTLNSGGNLQLDQNVTATGGTATLVTNSGKAIETSGRILAAKLDVTSLNAPIFASTGNTAGTIAARITSIGQGFNYTLPSGTLTVGTISNAGITVNQGTVVLSATAGDLIVSSNIQTGFNGGVTLKASGAVTETTGAVTAAVLNVTAGNSSALTGSNGVGMVGATLSNAGSSFYFANLGATTTGAIGTVNGDVGIQSSSTLTIGGVINAGTGTVRLVSTGNLLENLTGVIVASALGAEDLSGVPGSGIALKNNNLLGSAATPGIFAASNANSSGSIEFTNGPAGAGWTLQIGTVAAPAVAVPGFGFTSLSGVTTTPGGGNFNSVGLVATGTLELVRNVAAPGSQVLLSASGSVKESTGLILSPGALQAQGLAVISGQGVFVSKFNKIGTIAAQIKNANESFDAESAGTLVVGNVLGVNGISTNGGSISLLTTTGDVAVTAPVSAQGGAVALISYYGAVTESLAGTIAGGQLAVSAATTSVLAGQNNVPYLGASISGAGAGFTFVDTTGLSFTGLGGVTSSGGDVTLQVAGNLYVNQPLNAGTGAVRLSSLGSITQSPNGLITAGLLALRNESTTFGAIDLSFDNQLTSLAASNAFAKGSIVVVNAGTSRLSIGADQPPPIPGTTYRFAGTSGLSLTGSTFVCVQTAGALSLDAGISANLGTVLLRANGGIVQHAGTITANTLGLRNDSTTVGSILLTESNSVRYVAALNASSSGAVAIDDSNATAVTVSRLDRVTDTHFDFEPINGLSTGGNHDIGLVSGGSLTIDAPLNNGSGTVRLVSHGAISQTSNGGIFTGVPGVRNESATTGDIMLAPSSSLTTVAAYNAAPGAATVIDSTNPDGLTIGTVESPGGGEVSFSQTVGLSGSGTGSIGVRAVGPLVIGSPISNPAGAVFLQALGSITQSPGATITAGTLALRNNSTTSGGIVLTEANAIGTVTALNLAPAEITIFNGGALTVGTVADTVLTPTFTFSSTEGIKTTGDADIGLKSGGALTIDDPLNAGNGTVRLVTQGSITQATAFQAGAILAGALSVKVIGPTLADVSLTVGIQVGTFAAENDTPGGSVSFGNVGAPFLHIGSVAGVSAALPTVTGVSTTASTTSVSTNNVFIANDNYITLDADVTAPKANVSFTSPAGTLLENDGRISAYGLALRVHEVPYFALSGDAVTVLAAHVVANPYGEPFQFTQSGGIVVGTVDGLDGISTGPSQLYLGSTFGDITVNRPIFAGAGVVLVSTTGNVNVNSQVYCNYDTDLSALAGKVSIQNGGAVFSGGLAIQSYHTPSIDTGNAVSRLAAQITGPSAEFTYIQSAGFTVDSVAGVDGISAYGKALELVTLESLSGSIGENGVGVAAYYLNIGSAKGDLLNGPNKVETLTLSNLAGDVSFANSTDLFVAGASNDAGNLRLVSSGNFYLDGAATASKGNLTLRAGGAINQGLFSRITAGALTTYSGTGTVLTQGTNLVSRFTASDSAGRIAFANAGNLTVAGATELSGGIDIASGGALRTTGAVSAPGHITLTAAGDETIGSTVMSSGGGRITLTAGGDETIGGTVSSAGGAIAVKAGFGHDVYASAALAGGSIAVSGRNLELSDALATSGDLSLQATNELALDGTSYNGRNILLNTAVNRASNGFASIVFTNPGEVTLQAKRNFTVGYNQGIVANGSLTIDASTAMLSDTAARNALTVSASQVVLLDRQPNGTSFQGQQDQGLNFVSPSIDFGGATVSFSGQGNGKAYFAVGSGLPNVQRIDGVSFTVDPNLGAEFQGDLNALNGHFPDPAALPIQPIFGGVSGQNADVVAALAGALDRDLLPQPTFDVPVSGDLHSVEDYRPSPQDTPRAKARRALYKKLMQSATLRNP